MATEREGDSKLSHYKSVVGGGGGGGQNVITYITGSSVSIVKTYVLYYA